MKDIKEIRNEQPAIPTLIPGTFSICPYCDEYNELCTKYDQPKNGWNEIGDWTWENYCLKNGGCDRWF